MPISEIVDNKILDNRVKEFWPKDGPDIHEINKYIKKYSKEKIVIKIILNLEK